MNEDEKDYIKAIAEGAVAGAVDKLPKVYTDLFKPSLKVIGDGLGSGAKYLVNLIATAATGVDPSAKRLLEDAAPKIALITEENLQPPSRIAIGKIYEGYQHVEDEPLLRKMFATLLAGAMNKEKAITGIAVYAEVLKNLTTKDAQIIEFLNWYQSFYHFYSPADQKWAYPTKSLYFQEAQIFAPYEGAPIPFKDGELIDLFNVGRLGIVDIYEKNGSLPNNTIELRKTIVHVPDDSRNDTEPSRIETRLCKLTPFGLDFASSCIG